MTDNTDGKQTLTQACDSCGAEARPSARFCDQCGSPIHVMCSTCGSTLGTRGACAECASALAALVTSKSFEAERRQATVLFCDLVEFTPLSTRLDPEDLRDVLQVFRDEVSTVVREQGGFIASYMGDGVLVLFGYPKTYEDAANRAVHAALAIIVQVGRLVLPCNVTLRVRAGISTGVVVVGNLIEQEKARDEPVVGQVANLAARLQAAAEPDSVLVSESTYRLIAGAFECEALGARALKGFDRPLSTWKVLRARPQTLWPSASSTIGAAPGFLAGRTTELSALQQCWQRAQSGVGQVALVLGDPGIGKTNLCFALHERVAQAGQPMLRIRCSERLRYKPFSAVISHVEELAGFAARDSWLERREKLRSLLATAFGAEQADELANSVGELFSERRDALAVSNVDAPEVVRERLLMHLLSLLRWEIAAAPALLIFEDLHWADSLTLELLSRLVAHTENQALLLVATARTGFTAPWQDTSPNKTTLKLERVDSQAARQIVQHWSFQSNLNEQVIAQILENGEGIPLFIEELTKAVVEGSELGAPRTMGALEVPTTLKDSLVARLDRLGDSKRVAHVASAIGRDASLSLISAIMGMSEQELLPKVQRLIDAQLLLMRSGTERRYTFKHAIVQETAYSMMLRSTRKQLHRHIAETIEARLADLPSPEPEVLAHHWREAHEPGRAITYLERAGLGAMAHAAHREAGLHFGEALELAGQLDELDLRRSTELRMLVQLGLAVSAYKGYAAPDVQEHYTRALNISRELTDSTQLFSIVRGLTTYYIVRADLDTATELSLQCLQISHDSKYPGDEIEAYTALGYSQVYKGLLRAGRDALERAVDLYRTHDGAHLTFPSVQDPAVASLCLIAVVEALEGTDAEAQRYCDEALSHATRLAHPFNRAYAHCYAAHLAFLREDYVSALRHGQTAMELSHRHGFAVWYLSGLLQSTTAEGMLGAPVEAAKKLEAALGMWRDSGARLSVSYYAWGLASCYRAAGSLELAKNTLEEALLHARTYEPLLESDLLRVLAELCYEMDATGAWRSQLRQAIDIARTRGARASELRAVRSWLARIDRNHDPEAAMLTDDVNRLALTVSTAELEHTDTAIDGTSSSS